MNGKTLLILGALFFSTQGVFIKLAGMGDVHPYVLNFYRVLATFLTLLLIVPWLDKSTFKPARKDFRGYFFTGLLVAMGTFLYTVAFSFAPVSNVLIISYLYPFFAMIFAAFLLGERFTREKCFLFLFALLGLGIANPFHAGGFLAGNLLALVNAVIYGMMIVAFRYEDKDHGIGDVMWFFLFATLIMLPLPFIYGFGDVISILPAIASAGVIATAFGHLFTNLGLEREESYFASLIDLIIEPLIGILLAVIILGESVQISMVAGGAILILSGILLQRHKAELAT